VPAASKEEGLALVGDLVVRFAANEGHYTSPEFDETSTREQFVNGLFDALGWDVLDAEGRGSARDVVFHPRLLDAQELAGAEEWDEDLTQEELAAREPVARIPDYAFRFDGSTRFFVEAKRAGLSLDSRASAFQVKSYAWSNRVRIGVLSNFRQLRTFETITRPDYANPRGGLVSHLSIDYEHYTDRWDQLWDLLSREAVAGGSIEQTARYRRGSLRVGDAFLTELTEWRTRLAHDLADRNAELDRWELAEATQRILDRLVFLRVCEDRTLEQDVVLRRYARRTDSYHHLQAEMRRMDAVYNGALFAPHFSERLEVSDDVIQRFIERLYFPYSPYRFDVIGVDLLGDVYERVLGAEITLDDRRRVCIEAKPEVRHAGGVYYTPSWVVSEIVNSCVAPLLEGRTPRTAENLRIVDPACGSGSFLLGAFDYLIEWHERYYTEHPDVDRDRHYQTEDGGRRLTSDAKAGIAERNLYGVDVDPQAVEVAQMSLYLKMLETDTGTTLLERPRLFPGPFLPRLNNNIRSGNSLLAPDDVPRQMLLDDDLRHRINPFDWYDDRRGLGSIFNERGGFDAVIGNPPYTRVQVLNRHRREEAGLYLDAFETAQAGYDIATLFVERGLSLLRGARGRDQGGRLGFIITRTFCETDAAEPLRRNLSLRRHVAEIVDFGAGTVFEGVSAYTLLLFLTRESNSSYRLTRVPAPPSPETLALAKADETLTASLPSTTLTEEPWDLSLPAEQGLLDRLGAAHPSLRDVTGNSVFQGVVTGADPVFRCRDVGEDPDDPTRRIVLPLAHNNGGDTISVERETLRPVVAGSNDLHRFRAQPASQWLILPYEPDQSGRYRAISTSVFQRRSPHAYAWLHENEERLRARTSGDWNDETWILFSRRQNLERFAEPKVLVPYMIKELTAVVDQTGAYFVNVTTGGYGLGLNADYPISREYLAALLNSELLSWALKRFSRAWRGDYFGARKRNLVRLPIAIADEEGQTAVVDAYDQCVAAAGAYDAAQSEFDQETLGRVYESAVEQFDRLVFDLYGVTPDELRLIRSI
jgi:hypothetical protein